MIRHLKVSMQSVSTHEMTCVPTPKIMVVDSLRHLMQQWGHVVFCSSNLHPTLATIAQRALESLTLYDPDVVIFPFSFARAPTLTCRTVISRYKSIFRPLGTIGTAPPLFQARHDQSMASSYLRTRNDRPNPSMR